MRMNWDGSGRGYPQSTAFSEEVESRDSSRGSDGIRIESERCDAIVVKEWLFRMRLEWLVGELQVAKSVTRL